MLVSSMLTMMCKVETVIMGGKLMSALLYIFLVVDIASCLFCNVLSVSS